MLKTPRPVHRERPRRKPAETNGRGSGGQGAAPSGRL